MTSLKRASLLSYISVIIYIVTGFFYTPLLVKSLGISDYGIYSLSASLIGYFTLDFGISAATARVAAKFLANGTRQRINDLVGITCKLYLLIDLVVLFLLCLFYFYADNIFTQFNAEELNKFRNVFLITSAFILINFPLIQLKGLFQAYEIITELVLVDIGYRVISFATLVTALLLHWELYSIVAVNVSCNLTAQLVRLFYLRHSQHLSINLKAHDCEIFHFILSFSMWATIAMIADKFFFGFIPTLMAMFTNTREIAIFAAVISIEGYTLGISRALSGIFLARVTKMVVKGNTNEEKTKLMIRVGRIQLYIIGSIVFGLITFGREFIHLWLGQEFDKSYICLILVLTPCILHLTQTIAEELIYATNHVKYKAIANITGSVICISSIILLAPHYGALGAAVGVFLSFTLAHNFLIDIFYHRRLGLNIFEFFTKCHAKILPCFLFTSGLFIFTQGFFPHPSLPWFLLRGICWYGLTLTILWFFCMNTEEKQIFHQILRQ